MVLTVEGGGVGEGNVMFARPQGAVGEDVYFVGGGGRVRDEVFRPKNGPIAMRSVV